MLELAAALLERLDRGEAVAVATVIGIEGSAPRTLGTAMAVDESAAVIGSISGGCVEGAVYEVCLEVLETGTPRIEEFGYSDDDAFAVGLACGGRIAVLVQRLDGGAEAPAAGPEPDDVGEEFGATGGWRHSPVRVELAAAAAGRSAGLALVTTGVAVGALLGAAEPESEVRAEALEMGGDTVRRLIGELGARVRSGRSGMAVVECGEGPVEALFVVAASPPRMIVFGAVDFSAALSEAAALLGYRVTICDARPVFATEARFPAADEVVVEWPADYLARTEVDERTAVVVLTHDDRFDVPLLEVALGLPVAYVGAMGSRRTHERRLESLRDMVDETALARLHSPIGLDIGASTPEETAVSILAEILAARAGATGVSLRSTMGAIHRGTVHAETGI